MYYLSFLPWRRGRRYRVMSSIVYSSNYSLLIEYGLFQGAEASVDGKSSTDRPVIEFPLEEIRALIATRVHIGHAGRIPYLLVAGFAGLISILCSEAPAKLLPIVLEDAFKLISVVIRGGSSVISS
jgi:metallo-beta-lactamase family protein